MHSINKKFEIPIGQLHRISNEVTITMQQFHMTRAKELPVAHRVIQATIKHTGMVRMVETDEATDKDMPIQILTHSLSHEELDLEHQVGLRIVTLARSTTVQIDTMVHLQHQTGQDKIVILVLVSIQRHLGLEHQVGQDRMLRCSQMLPRVIMAQMLPRVLIQKHQMALIAFWEAETRSEAPLSLTIRKP
jgi:hypothetical protein